MPSSRSRVSVGVWISPPKVSACPKPTSSSRMMRTFGASLRQPLRFDAALVLRFLQGRAGDAGRRRRRERQHGTVVRSGSVRASAQAVRMRRQEERVWFSRFWFRRHCNKWDRDLPADHFFGSTGFSCGRPPSSMSKSGSKTVLPCSPTKAGWALIHSLGFCCLGVGQQARFQIADDLRILLGDVCRFAGILGEIEEFGLAGQQRDLHELPVALADRRRGTPRH